MMKLKGSQNCPRRLVVKTLSLVGMLFASFWAERSMAADLQNAQIRGGWEAALTENGYVTTILRGKEVNGSKITQLSIQLNKEGESSIPEFFIESPECEIPQISQGPYDASSSKAIQLRSADGGFIIEGEGWMWSQSQALLVISNNVTTTIRKDLVGSRKNPNAPAAGAVNKSSVQVKSNRFSFNRANSKAIYQDEVQATDPGRLNISCGKLEIDLRDDTTGFKEILAEDQVVIHLLDAKTPVQAKGGRAVYKLGHESEDVLELLDLPTWSAQGYRGKGDRIQVTASEEKKYFTVLGNAWASLDVGSIRSRQTTLQGEKGIPFEISSDKYEFDGKEVRFEGFVEAHQSELWNLKCETLKAIINEENKTATQIEASGNVSLNQNKGGKSFTSKAQQAIYRPISATEESILLMGNAEVNSGEFIAKGERIEMNNDANSQTIRVTQMAVFDLPLETASSIGILKLGSGKATPSTSEGSNRIRVTSNEYAFEDNQAEFKGKVKILFQDGTLHCDSLKIQFSTNRK